MLTNNLHLSFLALIVCFNVAYGASAQAQLDPSAAVLFRTNAPPKPKKATYIPSPKPSDKAQSTNTDDGAKSGSVAATPPATETVSPEVNPIDTTSPAVPTPAEAPTDTAEIVRSLVGKEEQNPSDQETKTTSPPTPQAAIFSELKIAPGFIYNNSSSAYRFRDYSSSSPAISVGTLFWLSSGFGLHGSYFTTLGADILDDADSMKRSSIQQTFLDVGLRFRSSADFKNQLIFGVDYRDFRMKVPGDDTYRASLKSQGVLFNLEALIPSNSSYAWTFATTFAPKLNHGEETANSNLSSGDSPLAYSVGLALGGKYKFESGDQIFWNLEHTLERDNFSGPAASANSSNGVTPSGVSITNGFTIFKLGYIWGN